MGGSVASLGMANVLTEEKKQQVLALGRLGWSLRAEDPFRRHSNERDAEDRGTSVKFLVR